MKKEAFKLLYDMEDSWWYKGRKNVADLLMNKYIERKNKLSILDFGAGYGGMIDILKKYGEVSASEVSENAILSCKSRGYKDVFIDNDSTFSKNNSFDIVTLFDVVEHFKDDKKLVNSVYNVLKPGGYIVVTVPAYKWLWSAHDIEHEHYRRYTIKTITGLLNNAGFEIMHSSYWNMFLFLPAAIARLFGFSGSSSLNSKNFLNKLFYIIVYFESIFLRFFSLPFGTGIVIIGRKKV